MQHVIQSVSLNENVAIMKQKQNNIAAQFNVAYRLLEDSMLINFNENCGYNVALEILSYQNEDKIISISTHYTPRTIDLFTITLYRKSIT